MGSLIGIIFKVIKRENSKYKGILSIYISNTDTEKEIMETLQYTITINGIYWTKSNL